MEKDKRNELACLDKLVGSWQLSGDTTGTVKYEWLEGRFFLVQHVNMILFGKEIACIEIIGFGLDQDSKTEIRSKTYDNFGNTYEYVYEMQGDTLIIWGGEKGSPAFFKGEFTKDGNANFGEWVYPGGGYKSVMTKMDSTKK